MTEELFDYFKRHGCNVGTQTSRFDHVNRMAQACGEHLSLPRIVLINLDDALQQVEPVLADVVEAAEERTDERRTRFRREDRLGRREAQRDVDADVLIR